ncbi:hypothetical protein HK099_001570, partial [Clydaea vesicula]
MDEAAGSAVISNKPAQAEGTANETNPTPTTLPSDNLPSSKYFKSSSNNALNKFKTAAKKIIAVKRVQTGQSHKTRIGVAPGVDLQTPPQEIEEIHVLTNISVIDYDQEHCTETNLQNDTLPAFLKLERPSYSKVRWINVQGISFDVIKILGTFFKLHPLALEDIFHIPQRTKCDFYDEHLFVSMILLSLHSPSNEDLTKNTLKRNNQDLPVSSLGDSEQNNNWQRSLLFGGRQEYFKKLGLTSDDLEKFIRPDAEIEQCSFFMFKNGLIISIFQNEGKHITENIKRRLNPHHFESNSKLHTALSWPTNSNSGSALTLLRKTSDSSLLLHALIDGCVDNNFPLTEFYAHQINQLQDLVVSNPRAAYTKTLHMISKELKLIHRTLKPQERLIISLRDSVEEEDSVPISKRSKVYFGDILDHTLTINEELQAFEVNAHDLVDLTFNSLSHSTNESMRTLAVVSLIFLPTTFLAGVYGMNFDYFPELHMELG